uniref:Pco121523 n=1 Tax=Arundo donax TaxID=35708 RepID=A0A0A9DVJ5_ARUDO
MAKTMDESFKFLQITHLSRCCMGIYIVNVFLRYTCIF